MVKKIPKKACVENLAEEAGEAAAHQDLKMLYSVAKTLWCGYRSANIPVKDENHRDEMVRAFP